MIDLLIDVGGYVAAGGAGYLLARLRTAPAPAAAPRRPQPVAQCSVEGCDETFSTRESAFAHATRVHNAPDRAAAEHILRFDHS